MYTVAVVYGSYTLGYNCHIPRALLYPWIQAVLFLQATYTIALSWFIELTVRSWHSFNPFSHAKFTRSPSKLSFGTGSTRLRLLRGNRTSHAHNHDLCKGGIQAAAQMQPRERMQLHQPTHGTLLTHTSPPRPFFGFFFFFFFLSD